MVRLDTMEIDGLRFSFVGRSVAVERVDDVTVMSIDKHHTMLYAAGRAIDVLDFGDGTVATPAWTGSAPIGRRRSTQRLGGAHRRARRSTSSRSSRTRPPSSCSTGSGFTAHSPSPNSKEVHAMSTHVHALRRPRVVVHGQGPVVSAHPGHPVRREVAGQRPVPQRDRACCRPLDHPVHGDS